MGDAAASFGYEMYKLHLESLIKNTCDNLLLSENDAEQLQTFYLNLKNIMFSNDVMPMEYGELVLEMNDDI